jgi:hypothetical protein
MQHLKMPLLNPLNDYWENSAHKDFELVSMTIVLFPAFARRI